MSDNDYNVYKGDDDLWRAKRQDASKASAVGTTQKEVFERARELAKKAESEVSIHRGDNNRIRAKYSYGNDPKKVKG
jgi:hypothetical protein